MLTFSVTYTFGNSFTPGTVGLKYRFNNRTWRTPSVLPDFNTATYCASCPFPPGTEPISSIQGRVLASS